MPWLRYAFAVSAHAAFISPHDTLRCCYMLIIFRRAMLADMLRLRAIVYLRCR